MIRNFGILQQLPSGQIPNQTPVGGEEVVLGQVFDFDPAQLVEDAVFQFAGELVDGIKLKINCPGGFPASGKAITSLGFNPCKPRLANRMSMGFR
jgi:ATP-dependent protease ClpP protease subunit